MPISSINRHTNGRMPAKERQHPSLTTKGTRGTKKFAIPQDPLQIETGLQEQEPLPHKFWDELWDVIIRKETHGDEMLEALKKELVREYARDVYEQAKQNIRLDFAEGFRCWLYEHNKHNIGFIESYQERGETKHRYKPGEPLERADPMDPVVSKYFRKHIKQAYDYQERLTDITRGNFKTVNDYYLYYKYVVQGERTKYARPLQGVMDADYPELPDGFLKSFLVDGDLDECAEHREEAQEERVFERRPQHQNVMPSPTAEPESMAPEEEDELQEDEDEDVPMTTIETAQEGGAQAPGERREPSVEPEPSPSPSPEPEASKETPADSGVMDAIKKEMDDMRESHNEQLQKIANQLENELPELKQAVKDLTDRQAESLAQHSADLKELHKLAAANTMEISNLRKEHNTGLREATRKINEFILQAQSASEQQLNMMKLEREKRQMEDQLRKEEQEKRDISGEAHKLRAKVQSALETIRNLRAEKSKLRTTLVKERRAKATPKPKPEPQPSATISSPRVTPPDENVTKKLDKIQADLSKKRRDRGERSQPDKSTDSAIARRLKEEKSAEKTVKLIMENPHLLDDKDVEEEFNRAKEVVERKKKARGPDVSEITDLEKLKDMKEGTSDKKRIKEIDARIADVKRAGKKEKKSEAKEKKPEKMKGVTRTKIPKSKEKEKENVEKMDVEKTKEAKKRKDKPQKMEGVKRTKT